MSREILPLDFELHLIQINAAGQQRLTWEYSIGERTLDCTVHLLPDLQVGATCISPTSPSANKPNYAWCAKRCKMLPACLTGVWFRERLEIVLNHKQAHCAVALIRPDRIKLGVGIARLCRQRQSDQRHGGTFEAALTEARKFSSRGSIPL